MPISEKRLYTTKDKKMVYSVIKQLSEFQKNINIPIEARNTKQSKVEELEKRLNQTENEQELEEYQQQINALNDEISEAISEIEAIKESFYDKYDKKDDWGAYQTIDNISFEVDDELNLTKVHRKKLPGESKKGKVRTNGPSHSSIFVNDKGETRQIITEHGEGAILGAGVFGTVKVGQDAETGEPIAVKIQRLQPDFGTQAMKDFEAIVEDIAQKELDDELGESKSTLTPEDYKVKLTEKTNDVLYRELDNFVKEEKIKYEQSIEQEVGISKGTMKRGDIKEETYDRASKLYSAQIFLPGTELKKAIDSKAISDESCFDIARQICTEIDRLHDLNILHRDIKSANFIWDADTNKLTVIDFGFAVKLKEGNDSISDEPMGSPDYMPPEVKDASTHCNYSVHTDYYSTGKLMEELFENRPDVRQSIQPIIDSMLEQNPDDRLKDNGLKGAIQNISTAHEHLKANMQKRPPNVAFQKPTKSIVQQRIELFEKKAGSPSKGASQEEHKKKPEGSSVTNKRKRT